MSPWPPVVGAHGGLWPSVATPGPVCRLEKLPSGAVWLWASRGHYQRLGLGLCTVITRTLCSRLDLLRGPSWASDGSLRAPHPWCQALAGSYT